VKNAIEKFKRLMGEVAGLSIYNFSQ